jgi:hypothetical protein
MPVLLNVLLNDWYGSTSTYCGLFNLTHNITVFFYLTSPHYNLILLNCFKAESVTGYVISRFLKQIQQLLNVKSLSYS